MARNLPFWAAAACVAMLVSGALEARAQLLWCQKPTKPYCADGYGAFSDEFDFQRCRTEVEEFRRSVRRYLECLRDESDAAVREINSVIEAFNRRARAPGY